MKRTFLVFLFCFLNVVSHEVNPIQIASLIKESKGHLFEQIRQHHGYLLNGLHIDNLNREINKWIGIYLSTDSLEKNLIQLKQDYDDYLKSPSFKENKENIFKLLEKFADLLIDSSEEVTEEINLYISNLDTFSQNLLKKVLSEKETFSSKTDHISRLFDKLESTSESIIKPSSKQTESRSSIHSKLTILASKVASNETTSHNINATHNENFHKDLYNHLHGTSSSFFELTTEGPTNASNLNTNASDIAEQKANDEKQKAPCPGLDDNIKKMEQKEAENERKVQQLLKEVPKSWTKMPNKDSKMKMLKDVIKQIVVGASKKVVTSIPFFFFKICIPLGPLTFGCCPEAAFFPSQLYNAFSFLEKTESFKLAAQSYPDFLEANKKDKKGKSFYYICAQNYLSVIMTNLWPVCYFRSLNRIDPMTYLGMVPGDMPICMEACITVFF